MPDTNLSYDNPLSKLHIHLSYYSSDFQWHPHAEIFYQISVKLSHFFQNMTEENYTHPRDTNPIDTQKKEYLAFDPREKVLKS